MTEPEPFVDRFWQRVQSACEGLRSPRWVCILPLILFSPTLFFGRVSDDYLHYWKLHVDHEGNHPLDAARSLFVFLPNNLPGFAEMLPWWLESDVQLAFFRPISALTHWVDSVLWADAFVVHHLHSLAWGCLCVWAVHRVFNRVMGVGWPAVLCSVLFAVQDSHAWVNGWLANRNAAVAFVFGMLAVEAHIRWRTERRSAGWPVVLMALALCSAEAGVCAMAFIGSWAVVYEKNWKGSALSLAPYVLLIGAWRWVYRALGYGVDGFTLYADPIGAPGMFIDKASVSLPLLMANQWFKLPGEAAFYALHRSDLGWAGVVGTLCLVPVVVVFGKTIVTNKQLRFWSLSMVGALVPVSATLPGERLLLFCSAGFAGVLVGLLQHHSGRFAKWLLVLHLPIGAALCVPKSFTVRIQDLFLIGHQSLPVDREPTDQIVFLNGLDFAAAYSVLMPTVTGEATPNPTALFSPAPAFTLTRIDDNRIEIAIPSGWFERGAFGFVPSKRFEPGARLHRKAFTAEVLDVTGDGQPSRVRFEMPNSVDDSRYRWMVWKGLHYEEIEMNFPVGEAVFFPDPTRRMLGLAPLAESVPNE